MRQIQRQLLVLGASLAALGVSASSPSSRQEMTDSLVADHHIMVIGGEDRETLKRDSIRSMIENFYYDQFKNYQDPAAPYFLFMSHDANMAMGVGGVVRMRAYYDPGNSMPGAAFTPYNVPMGDMPLNRNHFGTTPSGTSLFLRVLGRNTKVGSYQLYIQAKFNGYEGRDFKLSKAYATLNDWTVGYATSTFSDGSAIAPTVDANGSTMSMDFSALLVRWMHTFKKSGITVAASVETPQQAIQTDENVASRSNTFPNLAAMVQYEWASEQHVRLSAITRVLPYRDLVNGTNHSPMGFGLQLSAVGNPVAPLTLYAIGNIGRSYSNVGGDFLMGQYDLVENLDAPGRLRTVPSWSYFLGASYHFSHKLMASVTFGQARNMTSAPREADGYKYGLYGAANVFYYFTPRISVGAEANFGRRQNFDGNHAWARRIGAMCQFSF